MGEKGGNPLYGVSGNSSCVKILIICWDEREDRGDGERKGGNPFILFLEALNCVGILITCWDEREERWEGREGEKRTKKRERDKNGLRGGKRTKTDSGE